MRRGLSVLCAMLLCGAAFGAAPSDFVTVDIHLASDPTVRNLQGEIVLNDRPKEFVVEFSAPMDRAATERAFWRNTTFDEGRTSEPAPDTSTTLGLSLAWENDQRLRVAMPQPKGRVMLFFGGAPSKDGQRQASPTNYNEMLAFDVSFGMQVLERYDFAGQRLGRFPVESEVLNFRDVYEGRYAIAGRPYQFDESVGEELLLLEMTDAGVVKYPLQCGKALWDPAGQGFLLSGAELRFATIEDIRAGRPGRLLYKAGADSGQKWSQVVGYCPSPDGRRIAIIEAFDEGGSDRERPCPLTLVVLDRDGKVLRTTPLPFATSRGFLECDPVDVYWSGENELIACPRLRGGGHVHSIDLAGGTVREVALTPLRGPLLDGRYMPTYSLSSSADTARLTDLATGQSREVRIPAAHGKVMTAGQDKFILENKGYSPYEISREPAPGLTVLTVTPDVSVRGFPVRGMLAGADERSVWLAVKE